MGLHTGQSQARGGDYFGVEVNRAARIMGLAYGGQILLSEASAILARLQLPDNTTLLELGEHRLKGLAIPERIFQLCHPDLDTDFPALKSLGVYKHNLPVQLTSFVGRERELAVILQNLQRTHLLTLLGPGGTGKTRLMLQAAEDVIDKYPDGVWLVELAPLTAPEFIAERIAAALGVQEQMGRRMVESLADYLRFKNLLLLIDNVEHLVQECAELVQHLLLHCPKLTILVTGREALFIEGEITLQIPSLSMPQSAGAADVEIAFRSEGVQLFVARAQAIRPDFELTQENAAATAEVVNRLDGIPLALELAASRLRMLSVEQIAARLNDRFRLLTGGRRTALPRQQTLQALIDWSWNLLVEKERILLRRISVFSGGCSLDAAQAFAQDDLLDEYEIFDTLEQLINKSLITVTYPQKQEPRYGMLESIRQYGSDRLLEAGEGQALRDRHAQYYLQFAKQAGPNMVLSSMLLWIARIELELNNLRSVIS